ncbi:MAG: AAA family ATPase [Candidatus Nomurabacteria bacterium]|jgi:dephospho-CoA kinase|nr:AAA family ATPase [Candidatus Nomurabacteria bacterium]
MKLEKSTKIIAIVGMTGSGKSTVVDYIKEKGVPDVYFGGVILNAMKEAGIENSPENEKNFREDIRKKEGNDFVVKRVIDETNKLIESGQHRILLDGLYTWSEYKILKHQYPGEVAVVAIVVAKTLRHHRLAHRPVRPFNEQEAMERDRSEIENLEKGGPIAAADYYIDNSGSIEDLKKNVDKALSELGFFE